MMNINYLERFDQFVLLVWLGIGIVLTAQFSDRASFEEAAAFGAATILLFYPFTTYLSNNLLKKAIKNRRILRFSVQFCLLSLLMAGFVLGLYRLFIYLEEIGVFAKSTLFDSGGSTVRDSGGSIAAVFLINFGFCGLRFFEENLRLHKVNVETQLQILEAQINPHFMFNVLNHVNILIKKEPDLASTLLVQYTDILRYQLYAGKAEFIRLGKEVEFLKDFIAIEQIRWKNSLQVAARWDVDDEQAPLSPFLLITCVENAFKHVSRSRVEQGFINIHLEQEWDKLMLWVENSKYPESSEVLGTEKASGLGLDNLRKRLDILYPGLYSLDIRDRDNLFSVTLKIKLKR